MTNYYKSKFYDFPIEVDNIWWELILTITDTLWRKVIYSWYDIISKQSNSNYITKCILWWLIEQIPKNVLIIWFWWWAYCKYLEDHISDINITGVDIDEVMFDISKKEFWIKSNNLMVMDWENAIKELIINWKEYDFILIDVYWNNWNIPENFNKKLIYENIKKILNKNWALAINFANYNWLNIWKYNKIHHFLKTIFWENFIHILSDKETKWNVSWVYNLKKKYNSEEINLSYLQKVKNWSILYDSNMIKNTIIKD